MIPFFPAHGALGYWDELIFISIAVIFLIVMGVSWVRSRALEPEFEDDVPPQEEIEIVIKYPEGDPRAAEAPERFKLD